MLPSEAMAKIDFRLVPDMIPEKQFERIQKHLTENGFSKKDIELNLFMERQPKGTSQRSFRKIVQEPLKRFLARKLLACPRLEQGLCIHLLISSKARVFLWAAHISMQKFIHPMNLQELIS